MKRIQIMSSNNKLHKKIEFLEGTEMIKRNSLAKAISDITRSPTSSLRVAIFFNGALLLNVHLYAFK